MDVLNTRPAEQAKDLTELLLSNNVNSINFPTIIIKPVALKTLKSPGVGSRLVFFVSSNAVKHYFSQQKKSAVELFKNDQVYAIGSATAQALFEQGIKSLSPTKKFDSKSLLQTLPNKLTGQTCLIIKGQDGLADLANGLLEKGAKVELIECYQRISAERCSENWEQFKQSNQPIVLITSVDLVKSLLLIVPQEDLAWLKQQSAIIFSKRIKQEMQNLNWTGRLSLVSLQSNQGILDSLENMRQNNE
jgi:uroporphyrinogen-III synthase